MKFLKIGAGLVFLLGTAACTTTPGGSSGPSGDRGVAGEASSQFVGKIKICKDDVIDELDRFRSLGKWKLTYRDIDGSYRYVTPTKDGIGFWIEAQVFLNGEVILRKIRANYVQTRTFVAAEDCKVEKSVKRRSDSEDLKRKMREHKRRKMARRGMGLESARGAKSAKRRESVLPFTDSDLKSLLGKSNAGVIYIWSPGMPLSYKAPSISNNGKQVQSGLEAVETAAKKLGLDVTVLLDPSYRSRHTFGLAKRIVTNASKKKASKRASVGIASRKALRRAEALEFTYRMMRTHYPAVLVYANGKLARNGRPGVSSAVEYKKYFEKTINEIKEGGQ